MADDDQTAADRAQQQSNTYYEVQTGEQVDDRTASAGITIRPGSGVESVRVRVPGMDEFETGPDQLREWLQQHGLVHTPQQWTEIDQQVQDAIQAGQSGQHTEQPPGHYNWDEQTLTPAQQGRDPAMAEEYNDAQSQAWQRLLDAWHGFAQQVQSLRSASTGEGEGVIQAVSDVITSLALINADSLQGSSAQEFNAWNEIILADTDIGSLHTAAGAVADAGDHLYGQWQAEVDRGNYLAQDLTPPIDAFIAACATARAQIVASPQPASS